MAACQDVWKEEEKEEIISRDRGERKVDLFFISSPLSPLSPPHPQTHLALQMTEDTSASVKGLAFHTRPDALAEMPHTYVYTPLCFLRTREGVPIFDCQVCHFARSSQIYSRLDCLVGVS